MGELGEVARKALPRTKFVHLVQLDKDDPTLAFVQPIEKEYWYKAWKSENAADQRALLHEQDREDHHTLSAWGIYPICYTNLRLGLLVYVYEKGKVVKAEITDIKSRIAISCVDLRTMRPFSTAEYNIFELFSTDEVGLYDNTATPVRLSKIYLMSGLEEIHKVFAESGFRDIFVWQLKMDCPDCSRLKYAECDLVSLSGVNLSTALLSTMRDNQMCQMKVDVNKIFSAGFTHVEKNFVWFRIDDDWIFERICYGISNVEQVLQKQPKYKNNFRRYFQNHPGDFVGCVLLARYKDMRWYRVGVIHVDPDEKRAYVEMIDFGFKCYVDTDELFDPAELELPLNYLLPRCVKAKVVDEMKQAVVGDDLLRFVGGNQKMREETPLASYLIFESREVLVLEKEIIDGTNVFTIQGVGIQDPRCQFGVLVPEGLHFSFEKDPTINNPQ